MARIPTNMRLFGEYVAGNQSPITEKDFTPEELSEMLRLIEDQDSKNVKEEEGLQKSLAAYRRNLETFTPDKNLVQDKQGNLVPKYTETEYNTKIQGQIEKVESKLKTYEDTKGKTSVGYSDEKKPEGLAWADSVIKSFKSPAYNVETSLGHFTARKNKNGTVTIKDDYDFLGYGFDKPEDIPVSEFLKSFVKSLNKPEAMGTLLGRTFFANRGRDVDITLDKQAKTAKTFKEAL
jgi:hypothetical protein